MWGRAGRQSLHASIDKRVGDSRQRGMKSQRCRRQKDWTASNSATAQPKSWLVQRVCASRESDSTGLCIKRIRLYRSVHQESDSTGLCIKRIRLYRSVHEEWDSTGLCIKNHTLQVCASGIRLYRSVHEESDSTGLCIKNQTLQVCSSRIKLYRSVHETLQVCTSRMRLYSHQCVGKSWLSTFPNPCLRGISHQWHNMAGKTEKSFTTWWWMMMRE